MLTDSRSFLFYAHHDYFHRILCNLIGEWEKTANARTPQKEFKDIIESILYKNAY